jgi:replicative DNA helicase
LGEELVASLIRNGDVSEFIRFRGIETLLKTHELESYQLVLDHVRRHGVLPSIETAEEMGIPLPELPEPPSFYFDRVKNRYTKLTLTQAVRDVNERLRGNPEEALDRFRDAVFDLSHTLSPAEIVDFRDAVDVVVPRYHERLRDIEERRGLYLGWKYIDVLTGGIPGGELVSIVGRPQQGKTQLLLWAAMEAWRIQHKTVVFVSMEMKPDQILERGSAIYTSTALSEILQQRNWHLADMPLKRFKVKLEKAKQHDVPLHVVDGKLMSTVRDIYMLCRQLKPNAVFIDGAYLLQHPDGRLQDHQRIKANCDALKNLAMELNIQVVCTWQFNREGARKRQPKGGLPGMENIAGSDAIATHSSLILALQEEDGNPKTWRSRTVDVLKGRQGETGSFEIYWNWFRMDFSQLPSDEDSADSFGC